MTRGKRSFGYIRLLPSKRYQASYIGPDSLRHVAPETFTAKMDAEGWLSSERRLIEWDQWISPAQRAAMRKLDSTQFPKSSESRTCNAASTARGKAASWRQSRSSQSEKRLFTIQGVGGV